MSEYQGDGQGQETLAHVVEMAGDSPKATVEDLAVSCARLRVDDVAGNLPSGQYELHQEKHGEDHEWS